MSVPAPPGGDRRADRPAVSMDSPGPDYDLAVVGGGINGAGIARDAAGRGFRVLLVERDDLASHTSSASTKLIHGGLRYLEHYEFALVRKALAEREVLLKIAPQLVRPLRFVIPLVEGSRPDWMIRAGLFLYDHLAGRERIPDSAALDLTVEAAGRALHANFERGHAYWDAWVDDARLVVTNARDAADRGATVRTRCACRELEAVEGGWRLRLHDGGTSFTVGARAVVDATGPWAGRLIPAALGGRPAALRRVRGSHIVVPALFDHGDAYLLQQPDGRITFAIPYEGRYTLIGTTEVDEPGEPAAGPASAADIAYLCAAANRFLRRSVSPADVVWHFSGVRPLIGGEGEAAGAISRDYRLERQADGPPALTVLGGKITTYRALAEQAVDRLQQELGSGGAAWTAGVPLPGGDLVEHDFAAFLRAAAQDYRWCPPALLARWCAAYGSRLADLLAGASRLDDLGDEVAPGLHAREIDYLRRQEWVRCADDLLWRRSKLGLHCTSAQRAAVAAYLGG
jgi:glycerol-3-phosphate dehydrogenase